MRRFGLDRRRQLSALGQRWRASVCPRLTATSTGVGCPVATSLQSTWQEACRNLSSHDGHRGPLLGESEYRILDALLVLGSDNGVVWLRACNAESHHNIDWRFVQ